VLLDDGGFLIQQAPLDLKETFGFQIVAAVEQTSSGSRLLNNWQKENRNTAYPIVDVATSWAKKKLEGPFIAEILTENVKKVKKLLPQDRDLNILISGKGNIGLELKTELFERLSKPERKIHVTFFDTDDSLESDIYAKDLPKELPHFDLVLGCTGAESISPEFLKSLKKGCILANCASSDREFNAPVLRSSLPENRSIHNHLVLGSPWEGVLLMNSGFPINFDGTPYCVHPNKIQLTQGLLLSGLYQATLPETQEHAGILPLDLTLQTLCARAMPEANTSVYIPKVLEIPVNPEQFHKKIVLLFPGSFDPPHFGHEAMLRAAQKGILFVNSETNSKKHPDEIILAPCFNLQKQDLSNFPSRMSMVNKMLELGSFSQEREVPVFSSNYEEIIRKNYQAEDYQPGTALSVFQYFERMDVEAFMFLGSDYAEKWFHWESDAEKQQYLSQHLIIGTNFDDSNTFGANKLLWKFCDPTMPERLASNPSSGFSSSRIREYFLHKEGDIHSIIRPDIYGLYAESELLKSSEAPL
jgi:nicotinic acid mononucleotide adenylyltransferase